MGDDVIDLSKTADFEAMVLLNRWDWNVLLDTLLDIDDKSKRAGVSL